MCIRDRVKTFLARLNARIERSAPAAAENFDGLHRIGTAGQGPEHVKRVGRVDVLIDDDHVAAEICAGVDLGGDQHRLARMAWVALLDRDDVEQAPAAGFVTPHASDTVSYTHLRAHETPEHLV